jgi:hypothetical protein
MENINLYGSLERVFYPDYMLSIKRLGENGVEE